METTERSLADGLDAETSLVRAENLKRVRVVHGFHEAVDVAVFLPMQGQELGGELVSQHQLDVLEDLEDQFI